MKNVDSILQDAEANLTAAIQALDSMVDISDISESLERAHEELRLHREWICGVRHKINAQISEYETRIISTYPFEEDFGEPGDRTLTDKIVTARISGDCSGCENTISAGQRIRSRVDKLGSQGGIHTYRWCPWCCHNMYIRSRL